MTGHLKVVELFAGVGGFRAGLEKVPGDVFETVWANQWEPGRKNQFAFDCYNRHYGDSGSVNVNEDINKVWKNVPEHDLLVGGFPCQDYSVAATKAKGIEGKKGVLWWNIRDIIHLRKPKYVLLENVDRLLKSPTKQRGRDFGIILRCLADEGYYVEWRVINAADYRLQQRRRRTFIFACRKDHPFAKEIISRSKKNDRVEVAENIVSSEGFFARSFPVKDVVLASKINDFSIGKRKFKDLVAVSDDFAQPIFGAGVMIGYDVYTRDVIPNPKKRKNHTLRDVLVEDPSPEYYIDGEELDKWKYMKGRKSELRTRSDGSTYHYTEGAIPFPEILDRAGRTMLTSEGTRNRASHLIQDPDNGRYRILTPVECERLNGFDDDWTAGMTERQRYFCMGNALVVQLVTAMGERISELERKDTDR